MTSEVGGEGVEEVAFCRVGGEEACSLLLVTASSNQDLHLKLQKSSTYTKIAYGKPTLKSTFLDRH